MAENLNLVTVVDAEIASLPAVLTRDIVESPDFAVKYEAIASLTKRLADAKKELDEKILVVVKEQSEKTGNATIAANGYKYTYVPGGVRETLDTTRLKVDHPELCKDYVKTSPTKESIRITKTDKVVSKPAVTAKPGADAIDNKNW